MLIEYRTTCKICSFLLLLSLLSAESPELQGYANEKKLFMNNMKYRKGKYIQNNWKV